MVKLYALDICIMLQITKYLINVIINLQIRLNIILSRFLHKKQILNPLILIY